MLRLHRYGLEKLRSKKRHHNSGVPPRKRKTQPPAERRKLPSVNIVWCGTAHEEYPEISESLKREKAVFRHDYARAIPPRTKSEAREKPRLKRRKLSFCNTISRAEYRGFSQNLQHKKGAHFRESARKCKHKKELPIVGSPLRRLQIYFITETHEMQTVILVFTDRHTEEHTPGGAARLCSNPEISGTIVDALTPDKTLQARLRRLIDNDERYPELSA